jgi:4-hydroxybenzoate polyprenyltransferase
VGIVGFVLALANYITWIIAPAIATTLMPINGLLWLIWWLMISAGLFRLARATQTQRQIPQLDERM